MFNQSCQAQTVDDIPRPVFDRGKFHQTVLAIFGIEMEGEPYEERSTDNTETDADPLRESGDIHDDEHHEHTEQPSGKDEQILSLQSLVLHASANALVDGILSHLEEE